MQGGPSGKPGEKGGKGMSGKRPGMGPGGKCVCPNCGTTYPHQPGKPCTYQICPECGSQMMREGRSGS